MPAEVLTAAAAACGSDVLTVVVGAPAALGPWPVEGHLLVVEADLERGQQLKQQLGEHPKAVVCVEVLAAQTGQAVDWHQFNDPRLNGPQALDTLRPLYPNLQQTGVEQRSGRRLEDVLNAWVNQQGLRFKPELELTMRQGDPLTALQGLGPWLSQLRAVQLAIRGASGHWQDVLAGWLGERGFRAVEGPAAAWQRDPLATQQLVAREQELRIAELEEQLSTQAVRLLLAQTRREELTAERDAVRVERDSLQSSLQELTVAQEELGASRESLQAAVEGITAERDQLQAELGGLIAERDAQTARADEMEQRLVKINFELDAILRLIDQDEQPERLAKLQNNGD